MARIDKALRKALTGISGILVTPFDAADAIAPARLKPIVDRAVSAGVHVLVANGNTGEFYALSTQEAEAMVHAAAEHIDGRVPLIGGVGRSIVDACKLARASRVAGAAALMVHQPPDPFVSPRGVVSYMQRLADAADGLSGDGAFFLGGSTAPVIHQQRRAAGADQCHPDHREGAGFAQQPHDAGRIESASFLHRDLHAFECGPDRAASERKE